MQQPTKQKDLDWGEFLFAVENDTMKDAAMADGKDSLWSKYVLYKESTYRNGYVVGFKLGRVGVWVRGCVGVWACEQSAVLRQYRWYSRYFAMKMSG